MTREATCPALLRSSKGAPPSPWLSAGLRAPGEQSPTCGQQLLGDPGVRDFALLGTSSTCQALPRAQHRLGLILAPNRTGWAKINTHLAGAVH